MVAIETFLFYFMYEGTKSITPNLRRGLLLMTRILQCLATRDLPKDNFMSIFNHYLSLNLKLVSHIYKRIVVKEPVLSCKIVRMAPLALSQVLFL